MHELVTESEIKASYQGRETAQEYVAARFESELQRLLHERQVGAVNRVMAQQRPARSLEIAPGPGRVTRDVRPAGELLCLEYNQGMIEVGQQACQNGARWIQGDAFDLPFDQEFDFVYSFRFVRHFQRADRERLYEQIRKVLKKDGYFVMDAVNMVISAPLRAACPEGYPIYDYLYADEGELRRELNAAGFGVVKCEAVQRWFGLQYKAQTLLGPRSRRLCRAAIRTLEALSRGPGLEWIVTCRRA
jgi:ubiquinone/menaquinone biosynthesis C-methylase UbiE